VLAELVPELARSLASVLVPELALVLASVLRRGLVSQL